MKPFSIAQQLWRTTIGGANNEAIEGQLVGETYRTPTETRLTHTIYPDIQGRRTWESTGGTTAPYLVAKKRSFDAESNLDALGNSSTGAPDFCRLNQTEAEPDSPLCVWLKHDRANRLTELDAFPDGTLGSEASTRSCFDYDKQGNVRRVLTGCRNSSTVSEPCTANRSEGATTGCSTPPTDYDVDDFGNVVRVRTPWSSAAIGETKFWYDARGNVIQKQTTQMGTDSWLLFTYDQVNRLTAALSFSGAAYQPLYYLGYDAPLNGAGCPTQLYVGGRLSYRNDSFGFTAYSYDAEGRVKQEIRTRNSNAGCTGGNVNTIPHTTYNYSTNGNLTSIGYPYGRTVAYQYGADGSGLTDRVSGITTTMFLKGQWKPPRPLVTNVKWEPYGGLRGYHYMTDSSGGTYNSLEYSRAGTMEAEYAGGSGVCAAQGFDSGNLDTTGRTRALWVSAATTAGQPNALGTGLGGILKQYYTWGGDQLRETQTCFSKLVPAQTNQHKQVFGYDSISQLTSVSGTNMPVRSLPAPAATFARSYGYDRRGGRAGGTAAVMDGCPRYYLSGADYGYGANAVDLLTVNGPNAGSSGCQMRGNGTTYWTDADGRQTYAWGAWGWWSLNFGFLNTGSGAPGSGGLDTVYKSLVINGDLSGLGPNYQYYYDALNRRRFKQYPPMGTYDEYFYDLGHQMLTSIGSNKLQSPDEDTVDDYVWLGGRAVAMIRGSFSTAWVRKNDDQASCTRLSDPGTCGIFHSFINDYLPKPVMMIASNSNLVTNAALYDEFGNVNRVPLVTGYDLPYTGSLTMGGVAMPQGGNTDAHVLYNMVDSPTSVTLNDIPSTTVGPLSQKAHIWSPWLVGTGATTTIYTTTTASNVGHGVQSDALEYRRYSTGATPMFTNLRFPGQFQDPETGYFENWNRYYDPDTGRYLSPEPILNDPQFAKRRAVAGMLAPVYSYAAGNPLTISDPDGRDLHLAWQNYWLNDGATIAQLEKIIDELNHPAGKCACALKAQNKSGASSSFADRWISVIADPAVGWAGNQAITNPLVGVIEVNPKLDYNTMKGAIAHEAGHLVFPYGNIHSDKDAADQKERFSNADFHCGGDQTTQDLHHTGCSCD